MRGSGVNGLDRKVLRWQDPTASCSKLHDNAPMAEMSSGEASWLRYSLFGTGTFHITNAFLLGTIILDLSVYESALTWRLWHASSTVSPAKVYLRRHERSSANVQHASACDVERIACRSFTIREVKKYYTICI